MRDYVKQLNYLSENTLVSNVMPVLPYKFDVYGVLTGEDDYRYLYPDLLDCMWFLESSRGQNMIGDNGKAIGHFQIHIDKHPVSYECAMDYDCSSKFTAQMIHEGKGYLWTAYRLCQNDSAIPATKF